MGAKRSMGENKKSGKNKKLGSTGKKKKSGKLRKMQTAFPTRKVGNQKSRLMTKATWCDFIEISMVTERKNVDGKVVEMLSALDKDLRLSHLPSSKEYVILDLDLLQKW